MLFLTPHSKIHMFNSCPMHNALSNESLYFLNRYLYYYGRCLQFIQLQQMFIQMKMDNKETT